VSERYHRSHDKLRAWISSQLPAIPDGFRVMLTGVVEKDGTFAHLKAASTSDETIAAEVIRVLENAPQWTPALDANGKPVRAFRYVFLYFDNLDYSDYELADDSNNDHGKRTRASFQGGGVDKFRKWVEPRTIYPNNEAFNGIRGDVMLNFAVDRDGNVVEITTLHSPNQALADEVIRVIRNSAPKWTPAKNAVGLPIKSYHTMGMIFYLKGDNKSHLERAGKARRGM
jgi:TonB family protein